MKGLLLKDYYLLTKYNKYYIILILGFIAFSLGANQQMYLAFFPCIYAGLIPVTLQAYDERERWTTYSGGLPVTKKQLVSAKYIDGLAASGVTILLIALAHGIKLACGGTDAATYLFTLAGSIFSGLIPVSLMLPFIFRFGAEKGRIVSLMIIGLVVGCVTVSMTVLDNVTVGDAMPAIGGAGLILVTLLICAVVYAASWALSTVLYNKREI